MPCRQEVMCSKTTASLLMQPDKGNLSDVTSIWAIELDIKTREDIWNLITEQIKNTQWDWNLAIFNTPHACEHYRIAGQSLFFYASGGFREILKSFEGFPSLILISNNHISCLSGILLTPVRISLLSHDFLIYET